MTDSSVIRMVSEVHPDAADVVTESKFLGAQNAERPYAMQVEVDVRNDDLMNLLNIGAYAEVDDRLHPSDFLHDDALCSPRRGMLLRMGGQRTPTVIRAVIGGLGYRPATLRELLSFGIQFPDFQLRLPVYGLGSEVRLESCLHHPCLGSHNDRRRVMLWNFSGYRPVDECYLIFPNVP